MNIKKIEDALGHGATVTAFESLYEIEISVTWPDRRNYARRWSRYDLAQLVVPVMLEDEFIRLVKEATHE